MDLTRNKPTVLVIEPSGDQWLTMQWAFGKVFQQVEPVWIAEPALAMLYLEACLNSQEALPKLVFISLSERHHEGGIKFLKLLKAHPLYGDIPVIVFTESRAPALIKAIYASSANACIYKPASYQQWRSCLEQLRIYWWDVSTLPQVPYGVF